MEQLPVVLRPALLPCADIGVSGTKSSSFVLLPPIMTISGGISDFATMEEVRRAVVVYDSEHTIFWVRIQPIEYPSTRR